MVDVTNLTPEVEERMRQRMTGVTNLEAWARSMGYDPNLDYVKPLMAPKPYLSPHFREDEFRCKHCGELPKNGIDGKLLDVLEAVREWFGEKPVTIVSGYRCLIHNRAVGGAVNSQHLYGKAADIVIKGVDPTLVWDRLNKTHLGGVGKYSRFTHVDTRGYNSRWSGS